MPGNNGVDWMTRTQIHGGSVDLLCECGHPHVQTEPLQYGYRLMIRCRECNVRFAMDVIDQ